MIFVINTDFRKEGAIVFKLALVTYRDIEQSFKYIQVATCAVISRIVHFTFDVWNADTSTTVQI